MRRALWSLPVLFAAAGFLLAAWWSRPRPSVTILVSASPKEIEQALKEGLADDKANAIIRDRKLQESLEGFKRRVTVHLVRPDEIQVSYDASRQDGADAVRGVLVDIVKNIGSTGKAPIVALDFAKKRPDEGFNLRAALGSGVGLAIGLVLRHLWIRKSAAKA